MAADYDDEFDEAWYLKTYPDVARAVAAGGAVSGHEHYRLHGKAEGRRPSALAFDPVWYSRTYPVALAEVGSNDADALRRHYRERGRHRGYLPHPRANRPENAAALHSPFGGLWIDQANALDLVDGRHKIGLIDDREAETLTCFLTKGYVILPDAVPPALIDQVDKVVEAAYHGEFAALRFECHPLSQQQIPWQRGILDHPAKALDLHWFSDAVCDAIFCPKILRFLHLIFERPALASQTLVFYRGSQQRTHQDSAYVPYSLPRQFAASWIALEPVAAGTGELEYFVESHRALPDFLYDGAHKNAHDAERLGAGANRMAADIEQHLQSIQHEAKARGLAKETFLAERGDVLIWHADLAHGGSPTTSTRSRKSLVTHYCPSEVAPLYFETSAAITRQHESGSFYATGNYAGSAESC
jgi:phytanoyl-CoA hydroxylase